MASKNPFGSLNIRRDDIEDDSTRHNAQTSQAQVLFLANQNQAQKKKKVRPEEKKKVDEEIHQEFEDESGFSVVKKNKAPVRNRGGEDTQNPEVKEKHVKNKGAYQERNNKVVPGKRQFDRQSGTGRGKEISKNGAGGKHTWGTNPKNIAREDDYNNDEAVFNSVLNPRPKRVYQEKENVAEEPVLPVVPVEETPKVEEVAEEKPAEETQTNEFDRRRKKKGFTPEENKAELLERPENALSVSEYLSQLKLKNQTLPNKPAKVAAPQVNNSDLKSLVRNEDSVIGVSEGTKKNTTVKKEKKQETVQELAVEFKTEEVEFSKYGNRHERGHGKKNNNQKFRFSNDEFPEL